MVAPTVAAVGLALFSYGFPQAGTCVEISIPQIILLLVFSLVSDLQAVSKNFGFSFLSTPYILWNSTLDLFQIVIIMKKMCFFLIHLNGICKVFKTLTVALLLSFQYLRGISIYGNRVFWIYAVCFLPFILSWHVRRSF